MQRAVPFSSHAELPILHSRRMRICEALALRSSSIGIPWRAWPTQPDGATTPEPPTSAYSPRTRARSPTALSCIVHN
eukprot:2185755-Pleurochrysis_carterae.AAC.2